MSNDDIAIQKASKKSESWKKDGRKKLTDWKTVHYKSRITEEMIMIFLQSNIEDIVECNPFDKRISIKDFTLHEFNLFIQKIISDKRYSKKYSF